MCFYGRIEVLMLIIGLFQSRRYCGQGWVVGRLEEPLLYRVEGRCLEEIQIILLGQVGLVVGLADWLAWVGWREEGYQTVLFGQIDPFDEEAVIPLAIALWKLRADKLHA